MDFLKLDGVGPGSDQGGTDYDNIPDVAAWSKALKATGRPIQFTLSWSLAHADASAWETYANGWRIDTDVECYCNTLVTWNNSVKQRWTDVVQWIPDAGPGHWNNLDSLDVGDGAMDGLTDAERQSYMTLWAIEDAPLIAGDDLTKLDSYGLSLLTNREVIAVDQAGTPARPVSQRTDQQVWYARNTDGSYTVALFNLGSSAATVTANWSDIGLSGPARVRNLWTRREHRHRRREHQRQPAGARLRTAAPDARRLAERAERPTGVHGTAATGNTVSLGWNAAANATGYTVSVDGKPAVTVSGASAEITGLSPSTSHAFTVEGRGHARRDLGAEHGDHRDDDAGERTDRVPRSRLHQHARRRRGGRVLLGLSRRAEGRLHRRRRIPGLSGHRRPGRRHLPHDPDLRGR